MKCSANTCIKTTQNNGRYCTTHYWRLRHWGMLERTFDERIDSQYSVDENGCWIWRNKPSGHGYSETTNNGKRIKLHRYMYERYKGEIPVGLVIDHLCRVRHCINPDHLEAVTNRENVLRGISISAKYARKTHCKHGHEFTKANTRVYNGGRYCRACARESARRHSIKRNKLKELMK